MATVDDVVVKYRLEVDQAEKELEGLILQQKKLIDVEKEVSKEGSKAISAEAFAANKRKALIKSELSELAKLRQLRKLAFDPKVIEDYNKKINTTTQNIKTLRGETDNLGKNTSAIFAGIGAGIAAAFSVAAIKQFASASIDAFLEAEQNAAKLKFAVTQIGGESEAAFDRLIQQSEKLQKITVFSDDSVQQAQAQLATFGLMSAQIEQLLPRIVDFASATKQDLPTATETFIKALEGQSRGLVVAGLKFKDTGTIIGNYNTLLDSTSKLSGAAAEDIKTLTGQIQQQANAVDELQEQVGEKLAPAWIKFKKAAFEGVLLLVDDISRLSRGDFSQLFTRDAKKSADATEELTKKIDEQTNANLKAGQSAQQASQTAIDAIRAELIERVKLNIEWSKQALASKEYTEEEKKGILERLSGAQAELKVFQKLAAERIADIKEQQKQLDALKDKELKASDLKKLSIESLNKLLIQNEALQDAISKSNVDTINLELAARKKANQELLADLEKTRERELQLLDKNLTQLNQLREQAIRDDKEQRIAAFEREIRDLKGHAAERGALLLELENKLVNDLNEIDKKRNVDPLFRVPEIDQIPSRLTTPVNSADETLARLADERAARIASEEEMLSTSVSLVNQLNTLWDTYTNAQIDRINRERDAKLKQLDIEAEAIEKQLDRRQISEREAEKLKEELLKREVAAEEQAARKTREIKRKQAILDKAAALIEITISTAKNIASTKLIPLIALYAALGAAQAATVAATPIPYKKGTKRAKGGLARVGEEGEELMMMPQGAKVLPNRQTREYADVIDAMFDNRFEDYVMKKYVTPMLISHRQRNEESKQESFAKNIASSARLSSITSSSDPELARALSKAGYIRNADEIGQAIARHLPKTDRYRR